MTISSGRHTVAHNAADIQLLLSRQHSLSYQVLSPFRLTSTQSALTHECLLLFERGRRSELFSLVHLAVLCDDPICIELSTSAHHTQIALEVGFEVILDQE